MARGRISVLEALDEAVVFEAYGEKYSGSVPLTVVLHIAAHAAKLPQLGGDDHKVLALLLSRWSEALAESEMDQPSVAGAFVIDRESIARVAAMDAASIDQGLARLQDCGLVSCAEAQDVHGIEISFAPAFQALGPALLALLGRDLMERHGADLRDAAERTFEDLDNDIDALLKDRPADRRLATLKMDYQRANVRAAYAAASAAWLHEPEQLYTVVDTLARFKERYQVLEGDFADLLSLELAQFIYPRFMILAGQAGPPPSANAA